MTTFLIYLFMGFLILACVYLSIRVDEGEVFDCNQCETEECLPECEHYKWRTG